MHIEINFSSFSVLFPFCSKGLYLQKNEKLSIEAIVSLHHCCRSPSAVECNWWQLEIKWDRVSVDFYRVALKEMKETVKRVVAQDQI